MRPVSIFGQQPEAQRNERAACSQLLLAVEDVAKGAEQGSLLMMRYKGLLLFSACRGLPPTQLAAEHPVALDRVVLTCLQARCG